MIELINVSIYNTGIIFLVETTKEEFIRFYYDNVTKFSNREYEEILEEYDNPCIGGYTRALESGSYIVFLKNGRSDLFVPHEIFHVCNRILCRSGVNHDINGEPWAYLIGWLTAEYYKKYWNWVDSKGEKV